jgi:putative two-component system response regulator
LKKIFVVDDNTSNLLVVEEVLSKNYDVYTLSSAAFLFSLLNNIMPDLIILDLLMPEVDGFDVMKQLKDDKRYVDIPVVILTSKGDAATEALGLKMGAVDFIRKPFSSPVLLDRIMKHIHE